MYLPDDTNVYDSRGGKEWIGSVYFSVFQPVPQNLRVPRMASKGSTESNREKRTRRHLWPLDVFSGLSMCRGSARTPLGSSRPDPQACFPTASSPLSAFGLEFHNFPLDKFLATPMDSMSNQNCCKGFHFKENVKNTGVRG